jgi:uncharacterized protein (TIGR00369 family)
MPEGKTTTRTRRTSWEDPRAIGATAAEMSGLDFMRALRDGELPAPPIAVTVGFELTEADEGRTVFTCEPGEHHYNLIGSIHGGLVATLIDSATGTAVHTTLAKGELYATVNLSVDMLRPVTDQTGTLITEGEVVHRGRNIAIATAETRGERDGKVYARGQATCFIYKAGARGG